MSKAMTFEEWWEENWKKDEFLQSDFSGGHKIAWDAARLGMIPEDEAVRIPDVGDWPVDANEIRVGYAHNSSGMIYRVPLIKVIPRPTPAWTPKVGDAVFFKSVGDIKHIGIVNEVTVTQVVVAYDSMFIPVSLEVVKQFSVEAIGKPWGEI